MAEAPLTGPAAAYRTRASSYEPDEPSISPAVRCASDMIEIIGFTPGAVGKAEASPIHTPETSCSSPRPSATDEVGSDPIRHDPI